MTDTPALPVDLALILAVDCSSSVDAGDYQLQMNGIASALLNPSILPAIAGGRYQRIALSLVQWSNRKSQSITIGWRIISTREQLEVIASDIKAAKRQSKPGGTGLAAAISFSVALLERLPFAASRRTIDVSGDGQENEGDNVALARAAAMARAITINGLPIITGSHDIEAYYREIVIGGPGAFVVPAENMASFRDAMTQKLLREISSLNA
jgi:hypothetical protein